jgi:hypothetical protein
MPEDLMRVVVLALVLSPAVAFAQLPPAPAPILPAGTVVMPAPPTVVAPAPLPPGMIALPQAAEPSECVTTTTVRCTGAAAPYAVPQPQPPAIVVPAPAPPPQLQPQLTRPTLMLDPHAAVGDGWHLEQTSDGVIWRARKRSTDSPAVWGTGLAVWLGSYALAAGVGTSNGDFTLIGWWPMLGAFFAASSCSSDSAKAAWTIDGLAQVGGFVTFLVGLAVGPEKMEREPVLVTPISLAGGGSGVGIVGRF